METFERTYKQQRGPEVPSFDAYSERIKREYVSLLNDSPDESTVQKFLERNPSMVPGSRTPGGSSGHWPLHLALITQPPLHGFNGRVPDFMWLSKHSGAWFPAMVEIERPSRTIYTESGDPRADFTHARNQLTQWRVWLNEPANQLMFMDHYGVDAWTRRHCQMGRHFILIYGRRFEFDGNPRLSKERGNLLSGDDHLMSFDRLVPEKHVDTAVTVKPLGNGLFEVVAVPETFGLCPQVARYLLSYVGLEEAIADNPNISPDRCKFLRDRIAYWREWAKSTSRGITGGDFLE